MKIGAFVGFAGRGSGGPEVFEREFLQTVVRLAPDHEYDFYFLDRRGPEVVGVTDPRVRQHVLRPSIRVISMYTSLPALLAQTRPDVFHALVIPPPFHVKRMLMQIPCSTLHRQPHLFPWPIRMRLKFLYARSIPRADRVMCPSEHVRDVMMEDYKLPAERFPVVYPGVNKLFHVIPDEERREMVEGHYGLRFPYFLFSGRLEMRKNPINTLEAFALFKKEHRSEHRLVISGGRSWDTTQVLKKVHELGIQEWVVDLGKTPLETLPHLYGAADALLFASLWEGFGMPIAEAMASGTAVITSNRSAMPETAGGAALLVNPDSPEDIAEAMWKIARDPRLHNELAEKGLERAKLFTWERTARKTLALYQEILGANRAG